MKLTFPALLAAATLALGLPAGVIRIIFWTGLGLVAAAFLQFECGRTGDTRA